MHHLLLVQSMSEIIESDWLIIGRPVKQVNDFYGHGA